MSPRMLALTRWWRQCTVHGRVWFTIFATNAVLNLSGYLGAPYLPSGNEGDWVNLTIAVVMAAFAVSWLLIGQRDWRRRRETEEFIELMRWWQER